VCGRDEPRQHRAIAGDRQHHGVVERVGVAHPGHPAAQQRHQHGRLGVGGDLDDGVALDRALEPRRRVEREEAPVVDDRNAVAEPIGLVHVVGDEEDGLTVGVEPANDVV